MAREPKRGSRRSRGLTAIVACACLLSLGAAQPAGAALRPLGSWGSEGAGPGQFANPRAVAVDANGVYVADTFNHRVQRFTPSGGFISEWGTNGSADGQFSFPAGITTGSGFVYVADTLNNRIQRFSPTGAFLGAWGTFGSDPGQFNSPLGLATDAAGNVYVVDSTNSRVQVFSPTGTFIRQFGADGSGDGQFETPGGIALDSDGNAYVADSLNARVQRFNAGGVFVGKWGSPGAGPGQFSFNTGVAITPSATVHVSDAGNSRIQAFSTAGAFSSSFGSFGAGPAQLNFPQGIASSAAGDLYVADEGNDRVVRYSETVAPPVVGRLVNVAEVRGQVLVAVPGSGARASATVPGLKGRNFVPITQARQIPVGSLLDTRKGTVRLTSARDSKGTTQNGDFTAGVFQVLQSRSAKAKGLTELRLKGSSFSSCSRRAKRSTASAAARRLSRRTIRRLRSNAKGRFRTRGRYSSATVRGTSWTTTDRCDGTLTKVTRGSITVRDLKRRKNITLRQGKSYLAKARR